jgi:dTDP-4-dehydrorhamnose reductase
MEPVLKNGNIRVLVLGVSGMLGNTIFRLLFESTGVSVYGTARSRECFSFFAREMRDHLIPGIDVENTDKLVSLIEKYRPDVVINCIGIVKQLAESNNPLDVIPINALFPHRLAKICQLASCRVIQMSTDCVYSGQKGMYVEDDEPDAKDLYGITKRLGELFYKNTVTLRTSIIGRELNSNIGLIDWFLSQKDFVKGYDKAIFSGLPTVEVARVIRDYVIPNNKLCGLYHLSSDPISKFELLKLVAEVYEKKIKIIPDSNFLIDRSLNSSAFQLATGYSPPDWSKLVSNLHEFG